MEEKVLVSCGGFPADFRNIHGIILAFRCSEYKEGLFEVMSYIFISSKVVIFTWLPWISSMLFSNFGSGSNFVASILLLMLIFSNFLSRYAGILERYSSCTINFDERLTDVSLSTSVASDRHSVYVLRGTSYFSISFNYCFCLTLKSINSSSCCSNILLDLSNLALDLL